MEQIYIGMCKCGGYGQVYNAETEAKLDKCHTELSEILGEEPVIEETNE